MLELEVNGAVLSVPEPPVRRTLAETLRDDLGLTGTKIACAEGHCGACTVQLDGVPVLSCITLVHTIGVLGLALNATADRDGHEQERERIRELLEAARDLWRALPDVEDEGEERTVSRTTFRLVHLADILAVTSGA